MGAAVATCPLVALAQAAPDTLARIAFTNATVIDGTGAAPRAKQTILVSRGIIEDVFEAGSRSLPRGVRVVDLAGKFVIPGLIDSSAQRDRSVRAGRARGRDAAARAARWPGRL